MINEKTDHPRGCGENYAEAIDDAIAIGSPPRMRGKRVFCPFTLTSIRITPADAGKTKRNLNVFQRRQDHPRGCGENRVVVAYRATPMGSPPRMRGKQR